MKLKHKIALAIAAVTTLASQPANAYQIRMSGQTQANAQLVSDVLNVISRYSKNTGGCSFVFSVHMQVMSRGYQPVGVNRSQRYEVWTVNACAAKQRFQIGLTPSPRGGVDYAVTPLTGRMPLTAR